MSTLAEIQAAASRLEAEIENAVIDAFYNDLSRRADETMRKRIAEIVDKVIGPFEDHVSIEVSAHGVVSFTPKDEIGTIMLMNCGVIQKLDEPLEEITFTINIQDQQP